MEKEIPKKVVYINACNVCGRSLKDEWKFCPFCKAGIETSKCLFCGTEIKSNWNYCPHCKNEVKTQRKDKQRVDNCNEWLRETLRSK